MYAGSVSGVSPFHLATRIIQEQGYSGQGNSISGTVDGYEGYYNYFNQGAVMSGGNSATINGMIYASKTDDATSLRNFEPLTAKDIFDEAKAGDEVAKELVDELEKQTGYKMIGNKSASGTEILKELGEEHMNTKALILYTSADSVLQLAAHEETFGVEELYRCCKIAREITMKPEWMVGRVIARTFVGNAKDGFTRTANRHDYAISPFGPTVLNTLKDNDLSVIGIGKISDIYNGSGITESHRNLSNHHGMEQIINFAEKDFTGLCFLNLVDFDAAYGHRRDPQGYAKCLEEFDVQLAEFLEKITEEDLVIITADHGNDPTAPGSDHTREYVPLVVYRKNGKNINLGTRTSFADIGATIAENFNLEMPEIGKSFLNEI
jgi:phosphopentomutase